MQRPTLNPEIFEAPVRPRRDWKATAAEFIGHVFHVTVILATFDLIHGRKRQQSPPSFSRVARSLLHWLMFLPAMIALLSATLVYIGTHPVIGGSQRDPMSLGIYFDPVAFTSSDGTPLEGWLVPVVNATRILADKEAALTHRHPAIVLVPDTGAPREQMLPLIASLHDAGYILLVITPRGNEAAARTGSTFGIRESVDVQSAVYMLRRRPFVDPRRVAVLGVGAGGNAALLAARNDPSIKTLVVLSPAESGNEIVADRLAPRQEWLQWMRPLCKWTFELAYQANLDELEMSRFQNILGDEGTLRLTEGQALRPAGRAQLQEFLGRRLPDGKSAPLTRAH